MYYLVNNIILVTLVLLSMIFDVIERRIPNFLTFPIIVWSLFSSIAFNGVNGIAFSISGFIIGLSVFFVPFALGGLGAGDVKLMGAIGSLMGWRFILISALLTSIVGGLLSVGFLIYSGRLIQTLKNVVGIMLKPVIGFIYLQTNSNRVLKLYSYFIQVDCSTEKVHLPYGVAIGIGTLLVMTGKFEGVLPF